MYRFAEISLAVVVVIAGVTHLTVVGQSASSDRTQVSRQASWTDHVAVIDDALAQQDVSAAVSAWHDAYGAALATRQWEPMLRVGDAFLRIGGAAKSLGGARANARQAYLVALMRAQRERSVDGALQTAEAFAALGDRTAAAACAQVAKGIAEERQDRVAVERVRVFTTTRLPERS